jgi:hypothetical protein
MGWAPSSVRTLLAGLVLDKNGVVVEVVESVRQAGLTWPAPREIPGFAIVDGSGSADSSATYPVSSMEPMPSTEDSASWTPGRAVASRYGPALD